jgi:hypothetical protein
VVARKVELAPAVLVGLGQPARADHGKHGLAALDGLVDRGHHVLARHHAIRVEQDVDPVLRVTELL